MIALLITNCIDRNLSQKFTDSWSCVHFIHTNGCQWILMKPQWYMFIQIHWMSVIYKTNFLARFLYWTVKINLCQFLSSVYGVILANFLKSYNTFYYIVYIISVFNTCITCTCSIKHSLIHLHIKWLPCNIQQIDRICHWLIIANSPFKLWCHQLTVLTSLIDTPSLFTWRNYITDFLQ